MRKLSIIIPQYKESEELMNPLFYILNNQQGIDFGDFDVTIVNDCSDIVLSDKYLSQFSNLKIKNLRLDNNSGPGVARQYGADNSTGEFLWYIDADDLVYSYLAVYNIFNACKTDADVYRFKFKSETISDYGYNYHYETNNLTWLHGKIYSRELLNREHIRFPEGMRINEDGYYNTMVFSTPNIRVIDINEDILIWRCNPNSITRSEKDLLKRNELILTTYLDSNKIIFKELLARNRIPSLIGKLNHTLVNTFLNMQRPELQGAYFFPKIRDDLRAIYKEYESYIKQFDNGQLMQMYADARKELGNNIEVESYIDFIRWLNK